MTSSGDKPASEGIVFTVRDPRARAVNTIPPCRRVVTYTYDMCVYILLLTLIEFCINTIDIRLSKLQLPSMQLGYPLSSFVITHHYEQIFL